MIIGFNTLCNTIPKWSEESLKVVNNPDSLISPNDGSKGSACFFRTYTRLICMCKEDIFTPQEIKIPVFKFQANDGPRYHAYLPEWVCPFLMYSYPLLVEILCFYFGKARQSKKRTAQEFGLGRSTVRLIIHYFEAKRFEMERLPSVLQRRMDPSAYIQQLKKDKLLFSSFLKSFLDMNVRPFMVVRTTYSHSSAPRPYYFTPHGG